MALIKTLLIVNDLLSSPTTMESLQALTGLSRSGVIRHIEEARQLGADIRANGRGPGVRYILHNRDAVKERVRTWLKLEMDNNFISEQKQ